MSQHRRQDEILALVQQQGFVTIDELVRLFNVTPQTIRRDLNQLADAQRIRRHHGGAAWESSTVNTAYATRKIMNHPEKELIARTVAAHIPDGASVFINIGTTTETVAHALLNHKDLRIVTNNIHVASILSAKEDFSVIIAGGEVRTRDGGIVGEATRDFINQFRMDYGIIGISGIAEDGSLLDFDYREVRIAQSIIQNSQHVFLAADSSKFGRNAMVRLGNLSQVSALFTDAAPPKHIQELLNQHQVELYVTE
ncbi:DeoR/GlpR family transcriptional regulator [Pokkaliibacter sp. MBI-7]|uniref:DeoR/GlpR family transcriptional regulator n=1 Tax=Proteobacteria bacterium 228 TaxID=2083153 RepID=A0A2S5KH18_9PROT|nr:MULTISPECIES: DeoR/GlpR family transcriptional regulator [Pokkaliibacter]MDH2435008.1 DeoR/GlpR family transcriptional regulator [Pokkaliibacter sp. MBI-7]PPC74078.1 DeoR/GlpR family transcriptional regulator [Pokkaliibacter plantistimulans]